MSSLRPRPGHGPFHADQLKAGDYYELSNGHPIECAPAGPRHGGSNLLGGSVLASDPAVTEAGVDVGYSPRPDMLRAPDVSVGNVPDASGWVRGVPPLAVEYADTGSDERELQDRIEDLLSAGTKLVWVVRLVGPRRVEEYASGKALRVLGRGEVLTAPGVLQNPVPVEALWDRSAADVVTLRNLLQRVGYRDLDQVREEGLEKGREEGLEQGLEKGLGPLVRLFERRLGRALSVEERATLSGRLIALGSARLGDVVLDLTTEDLASWLGDPDAR